MGREVLIDHIIPDHVESLIAKLREMGVRIDTKGEQMIIGTSDELTSIDIKTLVYPGFATDLQQPVTALLTRAQGTSMVTDTIYNARFKHVDELRRMGADIKVEGRSALINGKASLQGAKVKASDLRAGAALVVASLMAEGVTEITGLEHIDRGYEDLEEKLLALGANVWRENLTIEEVDQVRSS